MSQFLYVNCNYVIRAFGVLLAAVMLWDELFRGQLGLSISFLEETRARNLGHLFVTPLRPTEWVASLLAVSLIRVLIGVTPAALVAIVLYHYSISSPGLPLAAFFPVLLSAGYYPVSILPGWLQHVAWALPSTYVFEGMRAVLFQHVFRADYLLTATVLDLVWLGLGVGAFFWAFRDAVSAARCCRWASEVAASGYLAPSSTVKPCFSNAGRAAGDSRNRRNFAASGFLLAAVSAAG
jgi:ABC-2 type transport system permease protein